MRHWITLSVAVDDEAREAVRLAPAESIGVREEAGAATVVERGGQPTVKEAFVDGLVERREEPAGQRRAWVVESSAEEMASRVEHLDGVAGDQPPDEIRDFAAIHPGMAGSETPIHARLEDQPRHAVIVTLTLRFS